MLTAQRKGLLLDALRLDGRVIAKDFAERLGLSEDTIRRDLRELATEGRLTHVHGGALPISPANQDYTARQQVATDSKRRVAAQAVAVLNDGQTVFIDGGTTSLAVCQLLPTEMTLRVITHSPTIASAFIGHRNVEVLLIGGRLYPHSMVTVGAVALEQVQAVRADVFLLGVSGISVEEGLTTGDPEEAAMKRAFIARAAQTYVLASQEKLATASPFRVTGLDGVTAAISDHEASDSIIQGLASAGLRFLASPPVS